MSQPHVSLGLINNFMFWQCCVYSPVSWGTWVGFIKDLVLAWNTCFCPHKHGWKCFEVSLKISRWFHSPPCRSLETKLRSWTCERDLTRFVKMSMWLWHVQMWTHRFAETLTSNISSSWDLGCSKRSAVSLTRQTGLWCFLSLKLC